MNGQREKTDARNAEEHSGPPGAPHDEMARLPQLGQSSNTKMAALAALYPAKLQQIGAFDRFKHYRLETGEQLLVWTPIYPAGPLPLIIYLHGASSRGDDIQQIFDKGPGCPPALLRNGDIAPRAVFVPHCVEIKFQAPHAIGATSSP